MINLDQIEQRILGVLLEKQRTVPDTYPMTENALVTGCNQSSNRDPVMSLQAFEIAGALMALHGNDIVLRVEGGSRAVKYRHRIDEILGVSEEQLAVLAELLLRGPQAPGALKPRVARMGFHATAEQVQQALQALASCSPALVSQEPRRPRERDHRWRHLLGDHSDEAPESTGGSVADVGVARVGSIANDPGEGSGPVDSSLVAGDVVMRRLAALERRIVILERALADGGRDHDRDPSSRDVGDA